MKSVKSSPGDRDKDMTRSAIEQTLNNKKSSKASAEHSTPLAKLEIIIDVDPETMLRRKVQ